MDEAVKKLSLIENKIKEISSQKKLKSHAQIIAVSKTFALDKITPLLEKGHLHYGESKIQEAENKWSNVKNQYSGLQLHMLGKLQTNKAKKAVKLFDYIHSLDNAKLAAKISQYEKELNKKVKLFIQVNIAKENQKTGILLNELTRFHNYCLNELSLNIIGLMSLPPVDSDPTINFEILKKAAQQLNLNELSMGMSDDYEIAAHYGSTYLRLGTAIFGNRNI